MWKYILISSFLFSGCSQFEFNFSMCDKIGPNDDPQTVEKCRNYNKEEADKAFNKTKKDSTTIPEDVIEFKKQ